ncbi:MAG: hypothetical protein ACFFEV_09560 [Candidatus Thorarchaeota archaeon]
MNKASPPIILNAIVSSSIIVVRVTDPQDDAYELSGSSDSYRRKGKSGSVPG